MLYQSRSRRGVISLIAQIIFFLQNVAVIRSQDHQMLIENCDWSKETVITDSSDSDNVVELVVPYPGHNFGDNLQCQTKVISTSYISRDLKLEVEAFDLAGLSETGALCFLESERVSFYIETTNSYNFTWCGKLHAQEHVFPGSELTVVYNSGSVGRGDGFRFKFSLVPKGTSVTYVQASEEAHLLYSPAFPKNYEGSKRTTVSVSASEGSYIHIFARFLDIEKHQRCSYDNLTVSSDSTYVFCGDHVTTMNVILQSSYASVTFTTDYYEEGQGYVLQYAAYNTARINDNYVSVPADGLYVVPVSHTSTLKIVGSDSTKRLHLNFLQSSSDISFLGTVEDGTWGHSFDESLRHYWSVTHELKLEFTGVSSDSYPLVSTLYVLVESVDGYEAGMFMAENTIARIQKASYDGDVNGIDDDKIIQLFVEDESQNLIKLTTRDRLTSDQITVHNGPSKDYFDLSKNCVDGSYRLADSGSVYSHNSQVLTISVQSSLWSNGFWMSYEETVESAPPETGKVGYTNFLDVQWISKYKNVYCFVETPDLESSSAATAEVFTNLEAPNRFEIFEVDATAASDHAFLIADTPYIISRPAKFHFDSTVKLQLKVWVPDPPAQTGYQYTGSHSCNCPVMEFTLNPDNDHDLLTYPSILVESGPDFNSQSAPDYLILNQPTAHTIWSIMPPSSGANFNYLELKVHLFLDDGGCDDELEVYEPNGNMQQLRICDHSDGNTLVTQFYQSNTLDIVLKRGYQWLELPQPLFEIKGNDQMTDLCGQAINIDSGDINDFVIKLSDLNADQTECSRKFLPNQLDTYFQVEVTQLMMYTRIIITGYDPLNLNGDPLKTAEIDYVTDTYLGTFNHMAIDVKVIVDYRPLYASNIVQMRISLEQTDYTSPLTVVASSEEQYIVSPNYPDPYPLTRQYYEWHIQGSKPLRLEMVYLDVGLLFGGSCQDNVLFVASGSEAYRQSAREFCGISSQSNVLLEDGDTNSGQYYEVTVKLMVDTYAYDNNHRGFMIRFKTEDDSGSGGGTGTISSSNNTAGVAVGATIATILLLALVVAAAVLFVMRRRKLQNLRNQRRRRELRQQRARGESGSDNEGNRSPPVFIVGSMVINTQAPPPPYPGPAVSGAGSTYDNGSGYYAVLDGGYINSQGQHVPSRWTGGAGAGGPAYHNEGYSGDEPPPYHPLMPGSPYGNDEHLYQPLSGTGGSGNVYGGQSNTAEYLMPQSPNDSSNTASSNRVDGNTRTQCTEDPYSMAQVIDGDIGTSSDEPQLGQSDRQGGDRQVGSSQEPSVGISRGENAYDSIVTYHYAVIPSEREDPPAYEESNPPHPPPAYDFATQTTAAASTTNREQHPRPARLGAL